MEKERKLTAEEKILIIKETLEQDSLSAVLTAINNLLGNKEKNENEASKVVEDNISETKINGEEPIVETPNTNIPEEIVENPNVPRNFEEIKNSGMIRPEALPAVLEDLENHESNSQEIVQAPEEEKIEAVTKVLTPRNNFAGARRVVPGENNE